MSNTVLILGESGTGKSHSMETLNPKETFVINVLDKPLPFRGFRKNYIRINDTAEEGNYYSSDKFDRILKLIKVINEDRKEIKSLIIDDFQYIMCNEFMRRSNEKGYQKFTEIGYNAWSILTAISSLRDDIDCFVMSHTESDNDGKVKCKTIGKMLDDKITIEGMFTIVFHTVVMDGQCKFLTSHDGTHVAKSPKGMFKERYIDNNLSMIKEEMDKYFNQDIDM